MKYPSKEAREIVLLARAIGWSFIGYTGSNHLLLVHENGSRYTLAATPSSRRNRANAVAMLERLSGRKIDIRPKRKRAS